jgi:site-specific recombinase XerD
VSELDPLAPKAGAEMYLADRDDLRDETSSAHYYRLKQFWEWCDDQNISNLNDLTGRDLHRYKVYRSTERDLSVSTVRGDLFTLRAYLEFCEVIDAVESGLNAKVEPLIPSLSSDEGVSDESIEANRVEAILEHLGRFEYASRRHTMVKLAWHMGCRLGALRAIDLRDFYPDPEPSDFPDLSEAEVPKGPFIALRHRADTDTPLKNGLDGERPVNISEEVVELVKNYVAVKRVETTDENGRKPLFTTAQGRISRSAVRSAFYVMTQPCFLGGGCPHGRDVEDCEALEVGGESLCPSSRAPHAVRTGAITHMRSLGSPAEDVSERVNATEEVIEKHYDKRTAQRRMNQRRSNLEDIL